MSASTQQQYKRRCGGFVVIMIHRDNLKTIMLSVHVFMIIIFSSLSTKLPSFQIVPSAIHLLIFVVFYISLSTSDYRLISFIINNKTNHRPQHRLCIKICMYLYGYVAFVFFLSFRLPLFTLILMLKQ